MRKVSGERRGKGSRRDKETGWDGRGKVRGRLAPSNTVLCSCIRIQ